MVAIVSGGGNGLLNSSAGTLGQQGVFGNPDLGQAKEGAYVNVSNGNLVLQDRDNFLAARGLPIALTRTYNSQGNYTDGMGPDWKLGLVKQVTGLTGTANTAGSTVTRIDADGSATIFTYDAQRAEYVGTNGGGGYQNLVVDGNGVWTWRADRQDLNGVYEVYDSTKSDGKIQSSGQYGEALLNYSYDDATGRLSTVTDATGDTTITTTTR